MPSLISRVKFAFSPRKKQNNAILNAPVEVILLILKHPVLTFADRIALAGTCQALRRICLDEIFDGTSIEFNNGPIENRHAEALKKYRERIRHMTYSAHLLVLPFRTDPLTLFTNLHSLHYTHKNPFIDLSLPQLRSNHYFLALFRALQIPTLKELYLDIETTFTHSSAGVGVDLPHAEPSNRTPMPSWLTKWEVDQDIRHLMRLLETETVDNPLICKLSKLELKFRSPKASWTTTGSLSHSGPRALGVYGFLGKVMIMLNVAMWRGDLKEVLLDIYLGMWGEDARGWSPGEYTTWTAEQKPIWKLKDLEKLTIRAYRVPLWRTRLVEWEQATVKQVVIEEDND